MKTAKEGDLSTQEGNSHSKTPRTFEEHSQGGDLRTLETNSHGRYPRNLKEPVERWRAQSEKWKKKRKRKRRQKESTEETVGEKSAKKGS